MAEAAIITTYFCHQCSQETNNVLPDYTCPRCRSGFIEMISNDDTNQLNNEQSSFVSDYDTEMDHSYDREEVPQLSDLFHNIYGLSDSSPLNRHSRHSTRQSSPSNGSVNANSTQNDLSNGESTRGRSRARISSENGSQSSPARPRTRYFHFNFPRDSDGRPMGADNRQTIEAIIQQIVTNFSSGGQGVAGSREGERGLFNIDFPLPLFQVLHGNPGDYAWGSGGLDVVITQLLNQLDSSGPPPMPKEEIEKLSYVAITAEQVSKNLQCTVCMEDFKCGEKVRCLMCTHCYHNDCIIPWLQMHATCPVCRKELTSNRINQTANNYRGSVNNESQSQSENSNTNQSTTNNSYEFTDDYD